MQVMTVKEKRDFAAETGQYNITVPDPTIKDLDTSPFQIPTDPPAAAPVGPGVAPIDPAVDPSAPQPNQVDENLKGLKVSEINKITSIVRKFQKGQLTIDQAKQLLSGYGLSEEQQTAWLS